MSRIYVMTFGLFLIFLGVQVFLVKAYVLTPEASRFVNERFQNPDKPTLQSYDTYSPFGQASYQYPSGYGTSIGEPFTQAAYSMSTPAQRSLAPPSWLCWPIFFLGAVVFLHGLALRSD